MSVTDTPAHKYTPYTNQSHQVKIIHTVFKSLAPSLSHKNHMKFQNAHNKFEFPHRI